MPGPYEKFECAFETFQEQITELLTTQQKALLEAIRAVPPRQPPPAPNPLAFYETILKVNSSPRYGSFEQPPVVPYFAYVYDDVLQYFGGPRTTDPMGVKFLEEAKKRFAYLVDPDPKQSILHPTGLIRRFFQQKDQDGDIEFTFFDFDERDFAVLRQLLEDLYKEQAVEEEQQQLTILTQQLQQELDKRQQQQAEQFAGIITAAFNAFRGQLTEDIATIPPSTIKQLEARLAAFREKLLQDIQSYVKTDKKEKELDKAVTAMQQALETMQKTRGIHDNNSQQPPSPEDTSFKF